MQWFMITGSELHQTLALVPFRGHFVSASGFLLIFCSIVLWWFCLLFGVFIFFYLGGALMQEQKLVSLT